MNEVVREPDTAEGKLEPADVFAAERLAMVHRVWYWGVVLRPPVVDCGRTRDSDGRSGALRRSARRRGAVVTRRSRHPP